MARWALVSRNVVRAVVEQPAQPNVNLGGTWVDVSGQYVGPGWRWTGVVFERPVTAVSLPLKDFLRRFTQAEREQWEELAATGTAPVKRRLAAFKTYLQTGGNVELADDYIVSSVQAMEASNVLAAGRADVILDT